MLLSRLRELWSTKGGRGKLARRGGSARKLRTRRADSARKTAAKAARRCLRADSGRAAECGDEGPRGDAADDGCATAAQKLARLVRELEADAEKAARQAEARRSCRCSSPADRGETTAAPLDAGVAATVHLRVLKKSRQMKVENLRL